jgi:predicted urease superfamily metal-dependent hydrolase
MKGCNIEVHLNIVKMEINAKHHRVRQYAIVQHHASNPKLNAYQTRGIFPSIFELFLLFYCGWII